ncbi:MULTISPECIES: response regulator transcription factor [Brevibacterium]|uniref:Sensory transduction protein RegX3 n=1 Tax=Brevibacterium salitolerans TaxID=1403566 RepID=A0ABN2WV19_9MICO|nr:response regulator transcription factor [Brevibacterium sp.]
MVRVLIVEDDVRLASALTQVLSAGGFEVEHVATGAVALTAATADIVLLDLGLPDMDGAEVLARLRARFDMAGAGILILSARGQTAQRVSGLRAGADDYIVKPVSIAELTARIEAVARRSVHRQEAEISAGDIVVDLRNGQAALNGTPVELTAKEFSLLAALVRGTGRTVPRDELILEVWGTVWPSTARSLEVHLSALRAKLGGSERIETVRGVGYRLRERPCTKD